MNKQQKPGLILIVDDVVSNLKVLFTYLVNAGFEVLVAQDGEEVVNKVKGFQLGAVDYLTWLFNFLG